VAVTGLTLRNPRVLGLLAAIATFAFDQAVKVTFLFSLGFAQMHPGEAIRVGPFFNLVMVWNKGVSFGLFAADSTLGRLFLLGFSAIVVAGLCYWLIAGKGLTALIGGGLGLVIGGALGNILDRLLYGAVADFFHLHAFGYDWYVFNIADAAIVGGVGLLLYESLLGGERPGPGRGLSKAEGKPQGADPGRGPSHEG
jgi:signal peptidase II